MHNPSGPKQRHSPTSRKPILPTTSTTMLYPHDSPTKQRRTLPRGGMPGFGGGSPRQALSPHKQPQQQSLSSSILSNTPTKGLPLSMPLASPKKRRFPIASPYTTRSQPPPSSPSHLLSQTGGGAAKQRQKRWMWIGLITVGVVWTMIPFALSARMLWENRNSGTAAEALSHAMPPPLEAVSSLSSSTGTTTARAATTTTQRTADRSTTAQSPPTATKPVQPPQGRAAAAATAEITTHVHVDRSSRAVYGADGAIQKPQPPPVSKVHIVRRSAATTTTSTTRTTAGTTTAREVSGGGGGGADAATADDPVAVTSVATTDTTTSHSRFAYVYVVGGCDPDHPEPYRNFLYSIVLATHLQRTEGSQQDVIVLVQLSFGSAHTTLPDRDVQLLSRLQIQVRYLDPDAEESFDRLMMDKYHLLKMTEYERVLYMDADVMARGNLDYLFELSADRGVLTENLVFAGRKTPSLGAVFMVAPKVGDFERVQSLRQHNRTGDVTLGWGHVYEADESYQLIGGRTRQGWDFPTAFSDEGLLFHWVKYEKRAVSIVLKDRVQNWTEGPDGKLVMKTVKLDVFNDVAPTRECWAGTMNHKPCRPPHSDFLHFQGAFKPWLKAPPSDFEDDATPRDYWFHLLSTVNSKYEIRADIANWKVGEAPLLGMHPNQWDTRSVSVPSVSKTVEKAPDNRNEKTAASGFAYAFVIGGVDPAKPAFRFFIQDVLVNAQVLHESGSTADIVVFFQMLYTSTYDALPESDLKNLEDMGIKVQYIPKSENESFDQIMLEKFRVLGLTQYERVMYLDSDVMLRTSLDYIFDLSVKGTLKRNVVFAGPAVPAVGTLFLVSPLEGDWDHMLDILREKDDRGAALSFPHWDVDVGWGHTFENEDGYELVDGTKGSRWTFPGSNTDQGLLYHWVKYEEKSVSIVFKDTIQNWSSGVDEKVHLESSLDLSIFDHESSKRECWSHVIQNLPCVSPWSDYVHFSGARKPWLHKPPANLSKDLAGNSPLHTWYHELSLVNDKLEMNLDFKHWRVSHRPLLGMHPNNMDAVVSTPAAKPSTSGAHSSQFAYAFVLVDCNPEEPTDYRNAIDDILVSTTLQRNEGSKADVIVFVQISYESDAKKLPETDTKLLLDQNITIEYIPKMEDESFERLALQKFRVVRLTQYDRVMFMATDIMARGSLDYLFQLSMDGVLKENMILGGPNEPAVGSLFMVSPKSGDWDQLLDIIRAKEERMAGLKEADWDTKLGWGHPFETDDSYETIDNRKKNSWDFPGASTDQGLLYHFTKYHQKSVSIVLENGVQNWGSTEAGDLVFQKTLGNHIFQKVSKKRDCWYESKKQIGIYCTAPHVDFVHFGSQSKPWMTGPPEDLSTSTASTSASHVWHSTYMELDTKLNIKEQRKESDQEKPKVIRSLVNEDYSGGIVYNEPGTVASPYSKNVTLPHRFAYTYVIGGCKPEDPSYRNYLNDIMISTYVAREDGSTADVIIFIQMSYSSKFDTLAEEDMRLLDAMQIQVQYIPKAEDESFYRIMLDKFLVLSLTQYERVIFMDGDVMLRGSLDYLCELSVQGVLKKNLVIAGQTEPANGGFFMLAPREGAHDRVMDIIHEKEKRGAELPYPHWDEAVGWGHAFGEGDYYELLNTKRKNAWDFYGAFADQGLLYHWVKYDEKSVSIVFRKQIQNWDADAEGNVHLENTISIDIFKNIPGTRECWKSVMKFKPCAKPHSDIIHFTGKSKPWLLGPPEDLDEVPEETSEKHYWFHVLRILNTKMQIGLDFNNWRTRHRPLLGMFPQHKHAATTTYSSTKR